MTCRGLSVCSRSRLRFDPDSGSQLPDARPTTVRFGFRASSPAWQPRVLQASRRQDNNSASSLRPRLARPLLREILKDIELTPEQFKQEMSRL
jgi:hypothetical protein